MCIAKRARLESTMENEKNWLFSQYNPLWEFDSYIECWQSSSWINSERNGWRGPLFLIRSLGALDSLLAPSSPKNPSASFAFSPKNKRRRRELLLLRRTTSKTRWRERFLTRVQKNVFHTSQIRSRPWFSTLLASFLLLFVSPSVFFYGSSMKSYW